MLIISNLWKYMLRYMLNLSNVDYFGCFFKYLILFNKNEQNVGQYPSG